MVFGDGHLNVRKRLKSGKYEYESSELRIVHSVKQKEYVIHKAELVRRIFGGQFTVSEYNHCPPSLQGRSFRTCGFSKSHQYFKTLKGMLYPCGIKTFTPHALEMITPHGIALWYMDDGSARVNYNKDGWISSVATEIATYCSKAEAELICDWFWKEYGIEFRIAFDPKCKEGSQYFIRANTSESKKFAALVQPYIIPSMLYKLSHVSNLNLHECRAPQFVCLECHGPAYGKRHKGLCSSCYSRRYHQAYKQRGGDIVRPTGNEKPVEAGDKELQR